MSWNATLSKLRDVLSTLYPTIPDTRRLVEDAGLNPNFIAFENKAITNWHNILQEAMRHNKVEAIIRVAHFEYEENSELSQSWQAYLDVINKSGQTGYTEDLLEQILSFLDLGEYSDAKQQCKSILGSNPTHPEANLITAICLLRGRGADCFDSDIIRNVRAYLSKAAESQSKTNLALTILGLIKYDHYRYMDEGEPTRKGELTLAQIKSHIQNISLTDSDLHYLKYVQASDAAYSYLGIVKISAGS